MCRATLSGSVTLAAALVLGGCATLWSPPKPTAPVTAAPEEVSDDMDRLMEDAGRFSGLSASERQTALVREEKRYRQRRTPYNLMRLGLLMTLLDPDKGQNDEVITALRDYTTERHGQARHPHLTDLAAYLSQVLERHGRLLERSDNLQKKLNELKAIEQKLNEQNKRDMIQVPP